MKAIRLFSSAVIVVAVSLFLLQSTAAQDDKLKQAMSYRPFQEGISYERPEGENLEGLTFTSAESIGQVGFLIRDENQQILRRFVDSDGDKRLDTWAYYLRGVEVYRDVDTDQDTKPDKFMWLGPEGSRIGLDKDQDRKIDRWQKISAQEVTREVVEALKEKNSDRLKSLVLSMDDLASLKLDKETHARVQDRLKATLDSYDKRFSDTSLPTKAEWLHFGAPYPGGIANSEGDLVDVFDNVSALYEIDGDNKQLAIGSLILVGQAWKIIDFPNLPDSDSANPVGGVFFQSSASAPTALASNQTGDGVNLQTLNAYQAAEDEFRKNYGQVDGKELAKLHQDRAKALMAIAIDSEKDRENWAKQYADIVSAAYQSNEYPDGLKELESQLEVMKENKFSEDLIAYTRYRMLNAWYSRSAENAEDLDEIQEQWQERLNTFIEDYPENELAAEALFELAKLDDYIGDIESAEKVYRRIAANFPDSNFAARSKGAVIRLTSEGKQIPLEGQTVNGQSFELTRLKGKMVLIHYWATWCEPCKAEFEEMQELYSKYQKQGFTIVSISVDESRDEVMEYLSKNRNLPWIHLYAEGGLDSSPLAAQLGVIALPTMMLVDKDGKVLERGTNLQQVERELRKLK